MRSGFASSPFGLHRIRVARAWISLATALLVFAGSVRAALVSNGPVNGVNNDEIEAFRSKGIPDESWPALLESLRHDGQSAAVRSLIKAQKPFPAAKLVALLSDPKVAVRLGALDLLEDSAGDTFSFDPWQEDPAAGGNAQALERWKAWAEKGGATAAANPGTLGEESFRSFASEIVSGERDRAERAMQRLENFGLAAIPRIQAFLQSQPDLEAAARAGLKCAEYRIVLRQSLPKTAAGIARALAFGAPQAQCAALADAGSGGTAALPVIADFLDSKDTLVRESAVDAAYLASEEGAAPLIIVRIGNEKAESVLHAMLRGLTGPKSIPVILNLLDHPSENVVISALDALGKDKGDDENSDGKPKAEPASAVVTKALAAKLGDPRWRIRAAVLEEIGKWKLAELEPKVVERMNDDDRFVRVAAAEAVSVLEASDNTALLAAFKKRDDLKAPILKLLLRRSPPAEIWEDLKKAPPEVILECLATLEDRGDEEGKMLVFAAPFATHPNRDVAAMALRQLASHGLQTGLLLDALQSGDPIKQDAVLDQLQLAKGALGAGNEKPSAAAAAPNPILDRLYDAVRAAAGKGAHSERIASHSDAPPEKMRAVLARFFHEGSPRQKFRAAVALLSQGDAEAAAFLSSSLETLSGLDRRYIAGSLGVSDTWPPGPVLDLAKRLLHDPADDVREKAIEVWMRGDNRPTITRLEGLLADFARPDSLLHADDIYGWELSRSVESAEAKPIIFSWAQKLLADEKATGPQKILAIVLLGQSKQAHAANVERFLDAPNPWLRRAAYRALGIATAESRLKTLLHDENAMVRAALPFLASPQEGGWTHWFDDVHNVEDNEDFDRRYGEPEFGAWAHESPRNKEEHSSLESALETLAHDSSDLVRFEAQFALLRLGYRIDPVALAGLVAVQPEESNARQRLGQFISGRYASMGEAYGVLVPLVANTLRQDKAKIFQHFGFEEKAAAATLEDVAKLAPASIAQSTDNSIAPPVPVKVLAQAFRVVFFFQPGCRDCERVRDLLNRKASEWPQLILEEHDVSNAREALFNEALSARFRLKDALHQVAPAVFTQAGALVRDEITSPSLGNLLRDAAAQVPNGDWLRAGAGEIHLAQQTVASRYNALSVGIVALAGLLDGINPCAFATIVFLLSYLQVARRTPREILAVGAAFILGVFVAYFLIGLGLAKVLARLNAFRVAGLILNYTLAAFALVVALLSFRDARLAAAGQIGEMALQLPGGVRQQIHSAIRVGARATRFVIAAFVIGIVISFLGLACTGQVYLPTIQYMLRNGRTGAIGELGIYNFAFVVPLMIVFALSWAGLRSEVLMRYQKRHTAVVKVLLGVFFLLLAAFLIFGEALIPAAMAGK